MIKTNLKVAWRRLQKNKLISLINVIGLGVGLTVGIFILLYVRYEFSYDQSISDKENIYRVTKSFDGGTRGSVIIPSPLAKALREEAPGVVNATGIAPLGEVMVEYKREHYNINNAWSVDSAFFQTIPLVFAYGDEKTALNKLDGAVISNKMAKRIFGDQNPVGEIILLENAMNLEVRGVLPPVSEPSHLQTDLYFVEKEQEGYWTGANSYCYTRIGPSVKKEAVEKALFEIAKREIIRENLEDEEETDLASLPQWKLQALTDIHLGSTHMGIKGPESGSRWQITMMSLIGLLILLLAAINYINLVTAQMSVRAKEIGIRNVAGATRKNLVGQFLSEALLVAFCALLVAIFLSILILPYFNDMISRPIPFSDLWKGATPVLIIGLTLFTALTSGIFPALYFSRSQPAKNLKAQFMTGKKTTIYRNVLIVSQFMLSIGLTLFVVLVWQQIDFMLSKDLGFKQEQIGVFRLHEEKTMNTFLAKKHQLEEIPGVEAVSQVSRTPGGNVSTYTMNIDGFPKGQQAYILFGDRDWNNAFQIPIKEGRYFSKENPTDTVSAFVVNETFVKTFNLKNPVGHRMKFAFDEGYSTIVGVVEDFHYKGMETEIAPMVLCARMEEAWMGSVAIRFEASQSANVLSAVSSFWKNMEPAFPVTYSFLDEEFAKQYESYKRFGIHLTYATAICLFLAFIGLFGLTVFIIQRKTKEIGIRKVLGASVPNIIGLLSKDFIKLALFAFIIAAPIAWYFVNGWLQNFAYRLEMQWWVFLLVGILAVGLVFITVSLQSLKAAMGNPVESIRSE